MTSKALDLPTIGHAMNKIDDDFLGGECLWSGTNDQQREFLLWYVKHQEEIYKLSNLGALASTDFAELNKFLRDCDFTPKFEPFKGIGVASVLDMLVQWAVECYPTTISRSGDIYPAFEISPDGADVYEVKGYSHPLVRLHTKTGHGLWLMKSYEPFSGMKLVFQAQRLIETKIPTRKSVRGVKVPMLEMDLSSDLSWLDGNTGRWIALWRLCCRAGIPAVQTSRQ